MKKTMWWWIYAENIQNIQQENPLANGLPYKDRFPNLKVILAMKTLLLGNQRKEKKVG